MLTLNLNLLYTVVNILVLFLLLLLVFVLIYRTGVPARCMPPEETLNIWGAFF